MATAPIVFIVGPTASGKTALAIEMAEQFDGEIISADSRTIYKGMDIGTAKPSTAEQKKVPHFGIDIVEPNEPFSAADFQAYANEKIREIRSRGHVPFVVGGTGLYVDAVLFDYQFGAKADSDFRDKLNAMTIEQLHVYCTKHAITLPENSSNKRYVIRAIEQNGINQKRNMTPIKNSIIVGITTEKDELRTRIERRNEQLLADGVVEEATMLGKKYGWKLQSMTGNIYPIIHDFLEKTISLDELKIRANTIDRRLAKRQLTWLKRNSFINWRTLDEAKTFIQDQLA